VGHIEEEAVSGPWKAKKRLEWGTLITASASPSFASLSLFPPPSLMTREREGGAGVGGLTEYFDCRIVVWVDCKFNRGEPNERRQGTVRKKERNILA
jgi:hypothetical protein